jgi:hypothetical protein
VSLEHTLFLDFLKLFVNMRLALSFAGKQKSYFLDLQVSRRSLGRAGMCCSQPARVDHLHKKWRAGKKKNSRKMGTCPIGAGQWPKAGRQPEVARWPRVDTCACGTVQFFLKFFYLKEKNF